MQVTLTPDQAALVALIAADLELTATEVVEHLLSGPLMRPIDTVEK